VNDHSPNSPFLFSMGSYASVIYGYIRFISTAALSSLINIDPHQSPPPPCESYYHHGLYPIRCGVVREHNAIRSTNNMSSHHRLSPPTLTPMTLMSLSTGTASSHLTNGSPAISLASATSASVGTPSEST